MNVEYRTSNGRANSEAMQILNVEHRMGLLGYAIHLREGWEHLFEPEVGCGMGWRVRTARPLGHARWLLIGNLDRASGIGNQEQVLGIGRGRCTVDV